MNIRKIQVYFMLVLIAFGFLLTFSIKNNVSSRPVISDSEWEKKQQFQEKMLLEQEKNQELERKLLIVNEQVAEMERRMAQQQDQGQDVARELEQLRMWLGLVPVTGRGIVITLEDSGNMEEGKTDEYIVREEHIRQVVNELFSAGAEAVSINGQRLTVNSAIVYSGIAMLVNGTEVKAPFEIAAIGDPKILKTALEMLGGVVRTLRDYSKIGVTVEVREKLELPAYTGNGLKPSF